MTIQTGFSRLFEMHQGIFYTRLLHQAIDLKVFDHLETKMTATRLADRLYTHPGATLHFLRGLAAAGLLEIEDGSFVNSELSQAFLVTETPGYLGEYLNNHARWNLPLFAKLDTILKNGPSPPETPADDEAIWAGEARALVNFQRVCTGPILARNIRKIPGSKGFKRMLDLGGGPGLNAVAVLKEHPGMTGSVLDRPAVAQVAKEQILREKMDQRLDVMAGDFTRDDLGSGWDLIMATACLNFAGKNLAALVAGIFDALAPGGVFVSVHDGMTRDRTMPPEIALSWLPVSMMWQELCLDQGQIPDAMEAAGFKTIRSRSIAYGLGTMELDIAGKALGKLTV